MRLEERKETKVLEGLLTVRNKFYLISSTLLTLIKFTQEPMRTVLFSLFYMQKLRLNRINWLNRVIYH